jgi:hypothetical protein
MDGISEGSCPMKVDDPRLEAKPKETLERIDKLDSFTL